MAQAKLGFAWLAIVTFTALAIAGCARNSASKTQQAMASAPPQSLLAPNGGFSNKTPAQRRAEWLKTPSSATSSTGDSP